LAGDEIALLLTVSGAGARVAAVAASPDGQHVYVAARDDNAVSVFRRDAPTGDLTLLQVVRDGQGGVDGLAGARSVAVSPDGKNVYAAGSTDNAVAVFSVDPATGMLGFRQVLKDGVNNISGIGGVAALTVSPDGWHVYAAGSTADALAVFRRNTSSGALSFVQVLRDGQGGVDGLDGAAAVTVSPDGKSVYAAGEQDDAVAVFRRSPYSGMLTFAQVLKDGGAGGEGLDGAAAVGVSPDGRHVYAAAGLDNALTVFRRDAATGKLTFEQTIVSGPGVSDALLGASAVAVSPTGSYLYAAAPQSNAVSLFRRDATTGLLTFVHAVKHGATPDGLAGVRALGVTADGEHLYGAGAVDNNLAVLSTPNRAPLLDNTGTMVLRVTPNDEPGNPGTLVSAILASAGGDRVADSDLTDKEGIAVVATDSTHGTWQYTVNGGTNWYNIGSVSETGARLLPANNVTRIRLVPAAGFTGLVANGITFCAWDGTTGTAGGLGDASQRGGSSAFSIAMETAQVTVTRRRLVFSTYVGNVRGPECVAVSPDGRNVYAVEKLRNALMVLNRNTATGDIAAPLPYLEQFQDGVDGVDGLYEARWVIVSPDGLNVYVTGKDDNAVAVFQRNGTTGRLTFLQVLKDGQGGVTGLRLPHGMAISPDGENVYVAGHDADSLVVFRRNLTTGGLTFLQTITNGVNKVKGLNGIEAVAVSPDGRYVYTVASNGDAVDIFSRNAVTGALTYVDRVRNGDGGAQGLLGALAVSISADGKNVYVAGGDENALAVFQRNAYSGRLTFVQVIRDDLDGIDGLAGAGTAMSVSVCPDGRYVYVTSEADGSLAVFSRDPATGRLAQQQVIKDEVGGLHDLYGASFATVSPDGRSVYVTGYLSEMVTGFQALNNAPVLDDSGFPMLDFVMPNEEDDSVDGDNPGTAVPTLISRLGGSGITDEDPRDLRGIAVTSVDTTNGAWEYSLNGGNTWTSIGSVSAPWALLLPADDGARIRLVPNTGFVGMVRDAIRFRAWDRTYGSGEPGTRANVSATGERTAFSAAVEAADVGVFWNCRLGGGQPKTLKYADIDGTQVTVTLSAGTADVAFMGDNLTATVGPTAVTVSGGGLGVAAMLLTGTVPASRLSFTTQGGTVPGAGVPYITSCGSLATISAGSIDLTGFLRVGGSVGRIQLDDIPGPCSISVSGRPTRGAGVAMTFDRVADLRIDCAMPIGSLTASEWLRTPGNDSSLAAPSVGRLTITGARGNRFLGTEAVPGDLQASVGLTGTTARQALGTLMVARWLDGAEVRTAGPIGMVTAGGMRGSRILAGVKQPVADLPMSRDDFDILTSIASLRITGFGAETSPFSNSDVAAWALGTISLKGVRTANGGHTFGVTGHTLTQYSRDLKAKPKAIAPAEVERDGDFLVQLVA
jgi:6-phosphogluconolactonase (cycloisomerase 2 family)